MVNGTSSASEGWSYVLRIAQAEPCKFKLKDVSAKVPIVHALIRNPLEVMREFLVRILGRINHAFESAMDECTAIQTTFCLEANVSQASRIQSKHVTAVNNCNGFVPDHGSCLVSSCRLTCHWLG